jgi:hypothetical protein
VWHGGDADVLDFTAKLSRGKHVIQVYGAESCCDGPTTWTFSYNDGPTE